MKSQPREDNDLEEAGKKLGIIAFIPSGRHR